MFRAHVLIIRRSKLHYTASGIIRPIGGRLVHETATYRSDDTRDCVMQFWPPDDEHVLEACRGMKLNLLWNKFCGSSWLNIEINILRHTVSKSSKFLKISSNIQSVLHKTTNGCSGNGNWTPPILNDITQWRMTASHPHPTGQGAGFRLIKLAVVAKNLTPTPSQNQFHSIIS